MERLLTGDRPTGQLHLGHYVGSLSNRVRLQHVYESFFIIADLHMLTTKPDKVDILQVQQNARSLVLDALSAGIDPDKATFYVQSAIHQIHEISSLLMNLVTVNRLGRIPSLKEMAQNANQDEMALGLLAYPVLQTADILCVRAKHVPVGKDNIAHIELTRELARRFNTLYGDVFPIPEALVSELPSLIGTDGKGKMSKSVGNAILLADSVEQVQKKVKTMFTDPNRIRPDIPGETEQNPVFVYHRAFNANSAQVAELTSLYQKGQIGDNEVKALLATAINTFLQPMRERRKYYEEQNGRVEELLAQGCAKVQYETQKTLDLMHNAMGFSTVWMGLGL